MSRRRKRRLRAKLLRVLHRMQGGLCAGCGLPVNIDGDVPANSPLQPTFDHYDPAHLGGAQTVRNGLLKHRHCNGRRGAQLPNGCDMIWYWSVRARLARIYGETDNLAPSILRRSQSPGRTRA